MREKRWNLPLVVMMGLPIVSISAIIVQLVNMVLFGRFSLDVKLRCDGGDP
jgi:hypothetical protein